MSQISLVQFFAPDSESSISPKSRDLCVCVCVCVCAMLHNIQDLRSRIFVPQPGTESSPSSVEAESLNYWATREFPTLIFFLVVKVYYF